MPGAQAEPEVRIRSTLQHLSFQVTLDALRLSS